MRETRSVEPRNSQNAIVIGFIRDGTLVKSSPCTVTTLAMLRLSAGSTQAPATLLC